MEEIKVKFLSSLRLKITAAFLMLSIALSVTLAFVSYRILEREFTIEVRDRLLQVVTLSAKTIDATTAARLADRLRAQNPNAGSETGAGKDTTDPSAGTNAASAYADSIEKGADYKRLSDELNFIRDTKPELIRYAYIWIPSKNEAEAVFLADADVLRLKEAAGRGEEVEEISHFGSSYDISTMPTAIAALREMKAAVDDEFYFDEAYQIYSFTGYAPIRDEAGRPVAVLGLDVSSENMQVALRQVTRSSILVGVFAIVITSAISIWLGRLFTGPVLALNRIVLQFGQKDFSVRSHVQSADEIGVLSANFNNMADTILEYDRRMSRLLESFRRFVPFEFLHRLGKEDITEVFLGEQSGAEMTILFSDIRKFTTLSEGLGPDGTFRFINGYLERIGPAVREHQGFIDKYIGDGIMALFPARPEDALEAAFEICRRLRDFNDRREEAGEYPVRIGIGIHTGQIMLGTIGENQRMDTTVIGDTVNLSSRIEGLTKAFGVTVLVSEDTVDRMGTRDRFRHMGRVRVVGREEGVDVYEALDAPATSTLETDPKVRWVNREAFEMGVQQFAAGRMDDAYRVFKKLYHDEPTDRAVIAYLKRIIYYRKKGLPDPWDGIFRVASK
jgi:class 3 adenylate cyclase/HAMP domain-containing protein